MIPPNLIINADDFGINRLVSQEIGHCVELGLINSFSVMPFEDPFHGELLKSLVERFPQVMVGCHLSLLDTPGNSAPAPGTHGLYEHPGYYRSFLAKYLTGRYPLAEIQGKWESQIQILGQYLGGTHRIAHLDSHQHLHILPGLWGQVMALQEKYAIPRVRTPYESLSAAVFFKFPFGLVMQILAAIRYAGMRRSSSNGSPRRLLGFFTSMKFTLARNRRQLARVLALPSEPYELMVHPGGGSPPTQESQELQTLADCFSKAAGADSNFPV